MIDSIVAVTPMANERADAVQFVEAVLDQLSGIEWIRHFVILDRVSTDGTVELIQEMAVRDKRVVPVWAPENRSVVDAYVRGYREALQSPAKWILEIDAGFSHRPDDIPLFLEAADAGADCVFGTRFSLGGRSDDSPLKRRVLSRGGTLLANLMLGTNLSDMTSGFQLFRREALEAILAQGIESQGPFFQTEMKAHARSMHVVEVPIRYSSPSHEISTGSVRDALTSLSALRRKIRLEGPLDSTD